MQTECQKDSLVLYVAFSARACGKFSGKGLWNLRRDAIHEKPSLFHLVPFTLHVHVHSSLPLRLHLVAHAASTRRLTAQIPEDIRCSRMSICRRTSVASELRPVNLSLAVLNLAAVPCSMIALARRSRMTRDSPVQLVGQLLNTISSSTSCGPSAPASPISPVRLPPV